jgi:hypothetical protein
MDHELSPHLAAVLRPTPPRPSGTEMATQLAIGLNDSVLAIYEEALARYQANLLASSPIILGLFNTQGGQFTLYRPGAEPEQAPPPPVGYQVVKGVSHSSMALYQLVAPYLEDPGSPAWHGPVRAYRFQQAVVLAAVDDLGLPEATEHAVRHLLTENIVFMDRCLEQGTFSLQDLAAFAQGLKPSLHQTIAFAADTQVSHWMDVLDGWKRSLGDAWDRTYGATNSLYVTRTNNILFTVMAQFFGEHTFNDRLLLFETTEFETDPDKMVNLLARIVADRALGEVFFKDYFLMDVELLSSGARDAVTEEVDRRVPASNSAYTTFSGRDRVVQEAKDRGIEPLLPPLAPFHTHQWPWRTDAKAGEGPSRLEDVT